MQYQIIQNPDPQVVVNSVTDAIAAGWRPQGGLAISTVFRSGAFNTWTDYAQALVKD